MNIIQTRRAQAIGVLVSLCVFSSLSFSPYPALRYRQVLAQNPASNNPSNGGQETEAIPWHLPNWKYRQIVKLATPLAQTDPKFAINTALVELDIGGSQETFSASDIRILDQNGSEVRFQPVDDKGEPLSTYPRDGKVIRIHFEVTNPTINYYVVYFGNPQAEPVSSEWEKRLGALTLETRPNESKKSADNFKAMRDMIELNSSIYNKGPRLEINDSENPFGPSDNFISIYEGSIYCPIEGNYEFATDSDDSSFLLVDNQLVVAFPGAHDPNSDFSRVNSIHLSTGVHKITYYHVQAGGGTLARAGWRPPGAQRCVMIPREAFLRELRTEPIVVEQHDSPLFTYFTVRRQDAIQFGNSGATFTTFILQDESKSAMSTIADRFWDFGDGTYSREPNPQNTFAKGQDYKITLSSVDKLGYTNNWTRILTIDTTSARRVNINMDIGLDQQLLRSGEFVKPKVRCKYSDEGTFNGSLVTETISDGNITLEQEEKPVYLAGNVWADIESKPIGDSTYDKKPIRKVEFRLMYLGHPLVTRSIIVSGLSNTSLNLHVEAGRLMGAHGIPILSHLSEEAYKNIGPSFLDKLQKGQEAHVLVVDDVLASGVAENYTNILLTRLKKRFPTAKLTIKRIGFVEASHPEQSPLQRIIDVGEAIRQSRPDLVILTGSLRDAINFMPTDTYERILHGLVDRIEAFGSPQIILVTPPPTLANPGLAQAYAIAVKAVGLRRHLPVADVFSEFLAIAGPKDGPSPTDPTTNLDWRELYRDPDMKVPLYHIAPRERGQMIIADTITAAIFRQ